MVKKKKAEIIPIGCKRVIAWETIWKELRAGCGGVLPTFDCPEFQDSVHCGDCVSTQTERVIGRHFLEDSIL